MFKTKIKNLSYFFNFVLVAVFCCFFSSIVFLQFNKKPNTYANSYNSNLVYTKDYEKYLQLTDDEKKELGVIPRMYEVSVNSLYSSSSYQNLLASNSELPTEYSLFKTNTIKNNFSYSNRDSFKNLTANIGNQKSTNICWAFASLTALETTLYVAYPELIEEESLLNFSELNLAYTTQVVNHNLSSIGGGSFELAYENLSYNLGPVYEQSGESSIFYTESDGDLKTQDRYVSSFLDTAQKSNYSALESFSYPARSSCTTAQQKTDLRNAIKNHIYTYGAITSSIAYNSRYYNSSSFYKYFCNPNSADIENHLITLVGWDDDFQITYGNETLTGAYIAQNSWGDSWGNDGFFYIMYDDAKVEEDVSGFVRLGKTSNSEIVYNNLDGTKYQNDFLSVTSNSIGWETRSFDSNIILSNFFKTTEINNQCISKIKIPTLLSDNTKRLSNEFYVYVINNISESNLSSTNQIQNFLINNFANAVKLQNKYPTTSDEYLFSANQVGMYSIELNEEIKLSGDYFAVFVEFLSGESVFYKSNSDAFSSQSSKKATYYSLNNGSRWNYFQDFLAGSHKNSYFPIIVQTIYELKEIEYVVSDVEKTYDGENVQFSVVPTNLGNVAYKIYYKINEEDEFVQNLNLKNAGEYKVYFKIVADFYEDVIGEDKFFNVSISKRDMKIVPESGQFKIYGDYDTIIDKTYQNIVSGEEPYEIGTLSREGGENVGEYEIYLNNFSLANNGNLFNVDNYNISFQSGVNYEICKRTLNVVVNNARKVYGSEEPQEFTFYFDGLANDEQPGYSGNLVRVSGENVGKYNIINNPSSPITLTNGQNGFLANNYELNFDADNEAFEILQKEIIVAPNLNQSKKFGELDPHFDYTWTGEVVGQLANFSGSLSREEGENVGEYEIEIGSLSLVDNGEFLKDNYKIVLTENVLFTINYGDLTNCEFSSLTIDYDGKNHHLTAVNSVMPSVSISYSLYEDGEFNSLPINFKNAGEYVVFAKFDCDNYNSEILQAKTGPFATSELGKT